MVGETDLAHRTKPNLQEDIYPVLDDAPPCQCQHTDDYDRSSALLFWQGSFGAYTMSSAHTIWLVATVLTVHMPELVHNIGVDLVIVHHVAHHLL